MLYLVNYANEAYASAQKFQNKTARMLKSFDKIFSYSPDDLDETFKREAADVLSCARGAGYWVWKPYVILKTLERMKDGEKLFYCDAGAYFVRPMRPLEDAFKNAKNGMMFFELPHINKTWTKRDVFVLLNCDTPEYTERKQIYATYALIEKSDFAVSFMREWLHLCMQKQLVSDDPNVGGKDNYPEFKDHRHDQSLLTVLVTKYGLDAFRNPSEFGLSMVHAYENSSYPQIVCTWQKKQVNRRDKGEAYADIAEKNRSNVRLQFLLVLFILCNRPWLLAQRALMLARKTVVATLVVITPRPLKTWRKNFLRGKN